MSHSVCVRNYDSMATLITPLLVWMLCMWAIHFIFWMDNHKLERERKRLEVVPEQLSIVANPCSVLQLKFNPLIWIKC